MATAAAILQGAEAKDEGRVERADSRLRALPLEDVFFYCKKIDNSRLVRETDPAARGTCWRAIGVASLVLVLLTGVLVPNFAGTVAGYRIETLRAEQSRLADERRTLELAEAELVSPQRLQILAEDHNLVKPAPGQVVHLNREPDGVMALAK
jgi:hypothetical protein